MREERNYQRLANVFFSQALICLVGLAAAAEEKDTKDSKDTKKRDVGAILGLHLDHHHCQLSPLLMW